MTTYKPIGGTRNPAKLAELLDAAVADVDAGDYAEADFDFDDETGALQHDSERCPTCRLYYLAGAYCGAPRAAQEAATARLWRVKLTPQEAKAAGAAYAEARDLARVDVKFSDDVGLGERYRIEAEVAAAVADERADIMAARLQTLRRQNADGIRERTADKLAGVVRHSYNPRIKALPYE